MSKRYTAILKIVEVEERPGTGRGDDKKFERETINIVVRAKDLDSMKTKLKAHIDLAEEL
jgi:hypothetical protein